MKHSGVFMVVNTWFFLAIGFKTGDSDFPVDFLSFPVELNTDAVGLYHKFAIRLQ